MSGLRIDTRRLKAEFANRKNRIKASAFRPELKKFAALTLKSCVATTPERSLSVITKAQKKQYATRVNYIPSARLNDVSGSVLIVSKGVHWLFCAGKWYKANEWRLPDYVFSDYQELLNERERRLDTPESEFIQMRAQARFLYKKSWVQVASSIGIEIGVAGKITDSHSRHNPPKEPPRGYGQWRGGKYVLSIIIYNPFPEQESRYKPFSGKEILSAAIERNYPTFAGEVNRKLSELMRR